MSRIRRRGRTRGPYGSVEPDAATLGARLAAARIAAGLTQARLARRLGVARAALAMYERDMRPVPARLLDGLHEFLPVTRDWPLAAYRPARGGTRQRALRLETPENGG